MALNFSAQEGKDFTNDLVEILRSAFVATLLEHRSDAADHLARKMTVIDDALQSFTRLIGSGVALVRQFKPALPIRDYCRQGLVDLVGD